MAFDIIEARSYGTASLGNATNPTDINSYARVTATASNTITIAGDDLTNFTAGTEILLHLSGVKNSSAATSKLGSYKFAKIMSVNGNVLTLSTTPIDVTPANWYYQAVTVPHYRTLTLSETLSPPAFDSEKGYGGILIFKAQRLNFSGNINLVDKGLDDEALRPLLNQESNGTLDTDTYSGHENYETVNHFTLQKGDGAAIIIAKRIDFESTARIGDPSLHGVQRCRAASDSYQRPTGATNIGGSSILIAAQIINDFTPEIIAKYRSMTREAGKGLARCYIATESRLPNDEGLYAYDIISTPERLSKETLIDGFGSGALGTANKVTAQQNNYAKVSKISKDGKTFTLTNITTEGIANFERNSLVMIHASFKSSLYSHVGRFFISKCVGITNDTQGKLSSITLANSINDLDLGNFTLDNYNFQAVAIPQYSSFSLNLTNNKTLNFTGTKGGIFAIAVNGICDLRGGKINVEGLGGSKYNLTNVSNARMKNRLPIGQGHGSIFILAKELKVNSATRLGSTSSGNGFGGASETHDGGGYRGEGHDSISGGSGNRGGVNSDGHNGGFASNASDVPSSVDGLQYVGGGLQGASLFIVAQKIDGLSLDCLSTGGQGGNVAKHNGYNEVSARIAGSDGGCGYGGGGATFKVQGVINNEAGAGGVHGGGSGDSYNGDSWFSYGGGASGFCTVYANEITNQSTTNLLFDNA